MLTTMCFHVLNGVLLNKCINSAAIKDNKKITIVVDYCSLLLLLLLLTIIAIIIIAIISNCCTDIPWYCRMEDTRNIYEVSNTLYTSTEWSVHYQYTVYGLITYTHAQYNDMAMITSKISNDVLYVSTRNNYYYYILLHVHVL